ncbi:hypothetical protein SEMRO_1965_G308280.1 [Seminavis robusta]|uniref:Uncharacterized protein n=1 Tax=Seminavis robusta TaxID=568900 RepID=A0A9N8EYV5_9STRA|nr:hypothetical protein SEMRO_1965_G308280.1 [Seminavis robusta]|eukprot:Sro1965_g308280.1 n/a (224) ;mRNA; r:7748-8419
MANPINESAAESLCCTMRGLSFVIVQDNARTPSSMCLKRARGARWQSVVKVDTNCQTALPSMPRRCKTPPSESLYQLVSDATAGNTTTTTSPNTRSRSPKAAAVLAKGQAPSLPRVPRRKTSGTKTQPVASPTTSPTNTNKAATSDSLEKLYSSCSAMSWTPPKKQPTFPHNQTRSPSSSSLLHNDGNDTISDSNPKNTATAPERPRAKRASLLLVNSPVCAN